MDRYARVLAWERAAQHADYAAAIHPSGAAGIEGPAWTASGFAHAQEWTQGLHRWSTDLTLDLTILDFGCGAGRVTHPLATLWPAARILGVDASPTMLARLDAAKPPTVGNVTGWLSDGFDGRLPDRVDAVHSMITLLHYSWADGADLLRRLLAALRPGGIAGVNVPIYDTPTQSADWTGVTTWCPAQLAEAADGLAVVLEAHCSPGQFRLGVVGPHHGAYQWLRRM